MGAVLEVTHRLLRIPTQPGDVIAVATTFEKVEGLEQIAARLLSSVRDEAHKGRWRSAKDAAARAREAPLEEACAISVVVSLRWGEAGLLATSRYVSVPPGKLHRSVYHSPNSVGSWVLQIAALFPVLRSNRLLVHFPVGIPQAGELRRRALRDTPSSRTPTSASGTSCVASVSRWGSASRPISSPSNPAAPDESEGNLARFLREAKTLLDAKKLSPTLLDILYLPDEADDAFALSSSSDLPGYAVTFTFEKLLSSRFDREEAALSEIADLCAEYGGRVHLVKNVCARPEVIEKMYRAGIDEMEAARRDTGAVHQLDNGFLRRVLRRLAPRD